MSQKYRPQPIVLPATLLLTMVAGVFQIMLLAILASPLIDDIGVSRTEIGVISAVNTLVGALTAPSTGRIADRVGPGRAVVGSLLLASGGMALLAWSPNVAWMYVAAAVAGIPQGSTNPSTNALISARVDPGRRGALTGIKQSGVTLALFLAGITLPALESSFGWRGACWVYAGAFAVIAVAVQVLLAADAPSEHRDHHTTDAPDAPLPPVILQIAAFAFFMGLAAGSRGRFIPLFAEESLGFSVGIAGFIVALAGLCGMAARITAGWMAEHVVVPTRLLTWLALAGAFYGVVLASLTPSTRGVFWLAPVLDAIGTNAWNAVAMLAVITFVSTRLAGRASGVVMVGFLGGLAVSGPIAGYIVDQTGTYRPVWIGTAVSSAIAAAIMFATDRRRRALEREESATAAPA